MKKDKANKEYADSISFNELIDIMTNNTGGQIKADLIKLSKNPKVYIVGDNGPEHDSIHSIHWTYDGAFKAWNELRISLLNEAKSHLKGADTDSKDMYDLIADAYKMKDRPLIIVGGPKVIYQPEHVFQKNLPDSLRNYQTFRRCRLPNLVR